MRVHSLANAKTHDWIKCEWLDVVIFWNLFKVDWTSSGQLSEWRQSSNITNLGEAEQTLIETQLARKRLLCQERDAKTFQIDQFACNQKKKKMSKNKFHFFVSQWALIMIRLARPIITVYLQWKRNDLYRFFRKRIDREEETLGNGQVLIGALANVGRLIVNWTVIESKREFIFLFILVFLFFSFFIS